ncbi:aldolase [Halobacteriales archaeon QS_1_68_17]|nr:MAG: aldolase [Halobacteriales archaeon QS_1_68_17]
MSDNLKQQVRNREHPIGTWISIGHPSVAELTATLDFDFLLVDTEHTTMSLETVENMDRATDAAPGTTETVIRVPWNDPVRLKRVLDIGIGGVMVPMIESAAEARELVEAVRYPPDGRRGIAAGRAANYGLNFREYVRNANGSVLTIVQIETEPGLSNVEEIARVDGIDALFVGPADLSGSLGVFGQWEAEAFTDAIDRVIATGDAADTPVGTLAIQHDHVPRRIEQGFDFLIVGKDTTTLANGNQDAIDAYERALAEHRDAAEVD